MKVSSVRALLTLFGVVLNTASARAVPYAATLLHPVGYTDSVANDIAGSTQVGIVRGGDLASIAHSSLWHSTSSSFVDLHPAGFIQSFGLGASDTKQVGYAENPLPAGDARRAIVWSGTSESAINLHPTAYYASVATAVSGNQQVGYGIPPMPSSITLNRALLWSGTADSVVDLHPFQSGSSQALDTSGTTQVGHGTSGSNLILSGHAFLWHGTAASVVDLHPSNFTASVARAVAGESQVGEGSITLSNTHALLWHGTAASVIDLNPPGSSTTSTANDISIAGQVGSVKTASLLDRATYWNGSAASAVDLHPFLGGLGINFLTSFATGITDDGIISGYATDGSNRRYAVMWTPIPEPTSCGLIACGALVVLLNNRLRRRT